MNVADNGPGAGASLLAILYAIGHIAVAVSKWLKERERRRAMESVPATEVHPQPPAVDRTDALVVALLRAQADLVDTQRQLAILRDENSKLALRAHTLEADIARRDTQLRVERQAVRTLREQLAHVEQELAAAKMECEVAHADLRRALLVRG